MGAVGVGLAVQLPPRLTNRSSSQSERRLEQPAVPPRNLFWLITTAVVSLICYGEAGRNRYAGMLSESIDKIATYYVEPVESRQLFEGGLRGMLNELDPYSGYISPDDYNQFRVDIQQQFGGIGIEVGVEDGHLTVLNPVPGSPAYLAGLLAGDAIVSIDGQNVEGQSLDQAVKLMRGAVGTQVRVEVVHRGETSPVTYELVRAEIRIESVRGDRRDRRGNWSYVLQQHPRIGFIRLMSFGDRTVSDLVTALNSIEGKVDGLIVDLRGNAGGLLTAAVQICDMFIPPGKVIVSTRGRDPSLTEVFWSEREPLVNPQLPIVVLVDRFSASASEIFAACLQDYKRATIVGERTWGKGTVQNVLELEGGKSAIRLTTQTYWRPSGENIHRHRDDRDDDPWGVRPSAENRVEFSADEYRQVYEARRKRDYLSDVSAGEPTPGDTGASPSDSAPQDTKQDESKSTAEPVVDRQLQRAIDVLLETTGAKAAA
jgi:carboxyl-terminal processing protease